MTDRIWTTDLPAHAGERVLLKGWLHQFRELASVSFLILRDAKGTAQVVVEDRSLIERLNKWPNESVIELEGTAVRADQAPGGVEIHDPEVGLISASKEAPPFDLFRPSLKAQLPTLLDHAPLTLRTPRHRAIFELAAASMEGFRAALRERDFTEIQTPKIVGSATEGGANVFRVDYFGRSAYLAQSPQLYKQVMVGAFERVFEVGPVFRAEPHDTPRHLNEYVSLDVELGFIHDHTTVIAVLRDVIAAMAEAMRARPHALERLGAEIPAVPDTFPVIQFRDAQELLQVALGEDLSNEQDLAPSHERWLSTWAEKEYGSEFLIVFGFPLAKRPFYTHPDPERPGGSRSFDLLLRGLELVTGGQRLHLYDDYVEALQSRGVDREGLGWYLEAFKHGMPPHGGFAIGLERWVSQCVRLPNLREATLFPRDLNRLEP